MLKAPNCTRGGITISEPKRTRLRAEERRESILAAAERTFARLGYRGAGMAEIAAEAGITQPLLYRHFKSKHELFLTCIDRNSEQVVAAWHAVPDLPTMGHDYLGLTTAGIEGLRLRMQALAEASDPEIRERLVKGYQRLLARIQAMVEQEQAAGRLAAGVQPKDVTWAFTALGLLIDFWLILDPEVAPEAIEHASALFGQAVFRQDPGGPPACTPVP